MNNAILITRPDYDVATNYISYYAGLIIKYLSEHGLSYKDFQAKEVNPENVHKFILKQNPKLLFLNGHGSEEEIEGDKGKILFSIKDRDLLIGKMIYARSCHLGAKFGKTIFQENSGCFIGYNVPFVFYTDSNTINPSKDRIARYILEPSNEVMLSLLKGNTALIAHNRAKDAMKKNMRKLLAENGSMSIVEALWNNHTGQVIYGDTESKL